MRQSDSAVTVWPFITGYCADMVYVSDAGEVYAVGSVEWHSVTIRRNLRPVGTVTL